jgi:predicted ATPase with chaperone activity
LIDRFDLIIEVPEVTPATLFSPAAGETTVVIARRVEAACAYAGLRPQQAADCANARLQPDQLAEVMTCDDDATLLCKQRFNSHSYLPEPIIKHNVWRALLPI